jgi:N-acetylmuramoyl-L-alanine amidase
MRRKRTRGWGMKPPKISPNLLAFAGFALGLALPSRCLNADESISLKYSFKPNQNLVSVLRDIKGKTYLPLMEVAQFYGVQVQFDSQTRRVSLEKGKSQIKLVLSQPFFMTVEPASTLPLDPVEVVSGQIGISPQAAEDVFGMILNVDMRYLPDQQILIAGGIRDDELRQEILAQAGQSKNSYAVPTPKAAVGVTQVAVLTAVPTLEPTPTEEVEAQTENPEPTQKETEPPSANQIYRVRRIIIDAGHGGTDAGAPGRDHRFLEKQATLDIAKRIVTFLKDEHGLEPLMTRHGDYYITLKYRTDFANSHDADLFVSIHCNSNPREEAHGTEVYRYSSKASNKAAEKAALRENFGTNYMDITLNDLHHQAYDLRSRVLAEMVERRIVDRLGQHKRPIQTAPFYVLCRVDMPSILIETAFISNREEENKLQDPYWRDKMAKAIADGIIAYKDRVEGMSENEEARR